MLACVHGGYSIDVAGTAWWQQQVTYMNAHCVCSCVASPSAYPHFLQIKVSLLVTLPGVHISLRHAQLQSNSHLAYSFFLCPISQRTYIIRQHSHTPCIQKCHDNCACVQKTADLHSCAYSSSTTAYHHAHHDALQTCSFAFCSLHCTSYHLCLLAPCHMHLCGANGERATQPHAVLDNTNTPQVAAVLQYTASVQAAATKHNSGIAWL
jgi:hypothetical protein